VEKIPDNVKLSDIRNLLEIIADARERFQMISLNRQLETARLLLEENPPIDVAVMGQFKAGKSSFLNSLLGQNVLPVGAIPVTTAITRLQYGNKERVLVRHFDGYTTEVTQAEISEFTSEAKIPATIRTWQLLILNCRRCRSMPVYVWLILPDWAVSINIISPLRSIGYQQ